MIKNERQYRSTKSQAAEFANALKELEAKPAGEMHPKLREAQLAAVRSQYSDMEEELREYEKGNTSTTKERTDDE